MSPKPWGKLELGYLNHPKFLALNANAICLWHEGKNYCDSHQTDGMIPRDALKTFRFRGSKSIDLLQSSCGDKPDGTPYAPLWEPHTLGFRMHDYLDHNDCRDEVLARIERAEERRDAEKDRKAKWRALKAEKAAVSRGTSRGTVDGTATSPSRSTTEATTTTKVLKRLAAPEGAAAVGQPVKAFLTLYGELFAGISGGQEPLIYGGRDGAIAKKTLTKFGPEKAHELLRAFFASSDKFIQDSGYGLNIFAGQINKLLVGSRSAPVGTAPAFAPWNCHHLEECSHRAMCDHKNNMPHKYPVKHEAAS